MPYLTVYTNVELEKKAKIAEQAAELTATVLHKPVSYVVTNLIYNQSMAFGGSAENKGALMELKSIGLGDKDKVVTELTSFFARELNITNRRYINIVLENCAAENIASNGQLFG